MRRMMPCGRRCYTAARQERARFERAAEGEAGVVKPRRNAQAKGLANACGIAGVTSLERGCARRSPPKGQAASARRAGPPISQVKRTARAHGSPQQLQCGGVEALGRLVMSAALQRTPLYELHLELGAKMVPF